MTDTKDPEWMELILRHEGKYYHCHYCVEDGMVTVRSSKGSTSAQIGGSSPEMLARLIFREFIEGGNANEFGISASNVGKKRWGGTFPLS